MKATIESTEKIFTVSGVPCRQWEGKTEEGAECSMFVSLVRIDQDEIGLCSDLNLIPVETEETPSEPMSDWELLTFLMHNRFCRNLPSVDANYISTEFSVTKKFALVFLHEMEKTGRDYNVEAGFIWFPLWKKGSPFLPPEEPKPLMNDWDLILYILKSSFLGLPEVGHVQITAEIKKKNLSPKFFKAMAIPKRKYAISGNRISFEIGFNKK